MVIGGTNLLSLPCFKRGYMLTYSIVMDVAVLILYRRICMVGGSDLFTVTLNRSLLLE
jgi:hypothetical protein